MCEYQDHAHTIQEELEALANKIDSDDIDYKDVINKLFDLSNKVPCGCGDLIESPESPSVDSIRDSFETYYDNRWLDNSGGGSGNGEIDIPNRVVEDVGTPVTEADNIENSPWDLTESIGITWDVPYLTRPPTENRPQYYSSGSNDDGDDEE
jgi:hypothetical protein